MRPANPLGRSKQKDGPSLTTTVEKLKNQPKQREPQAPDMKLKVVIRGLPPNLPETKFKEVTEEWINENTVDWYYYVSGKLHERYIVIHIFGINIKWK